MSDEIADPEDLGDGCYILSGEDSHLAELLGEFRHGDWARMMLVLDADTRNKLRMEATQYMVQAQQARESRGREEG